MKATKFITLFNIKCSSCKLDRTSFTVSEIVMPKIAIEDQKAYTKEELKDHCKKPKLRITAHPYKKI